MGKKKKKASVAAYLTNAPYGEVAVGGLGEHANVLDLVGPVGTFETKGAKRPK